MLSASLVLVYLVTILITYALCKISDEADKSLEEMRLRNIYSEMENKE
ncbi:hypothetical protein [Clostridium thailandense]|uniref:Uncharacterized protein n=1 Tax=Clostridium thailandense TaxID=2794346 RepID=A0A949U1Z0_9CLOT|nr:hypothetical protein [Clostridium thailandense]MBV7276893.1 hypothetical protein [Clostridium thailandense]